MCPQCGRKYIDGEAFCPFDGARLRNQESLPAARDPFEGRMLDGRYQIERVLGRGGMGTVYAGRLVALGKPCAIKVLRPVLDDDGQAMGRFEREARSASKLGNDHIVDIFDFGMSNEGDAFLVMELLEGQDLGELLSKERRLPLDRALPIIMQCCEALGAAHAASIVHRDLKPENIFLIRRDGYREFVKIVDFGLAKISDTEQQGDPERKLTKTGMIFGTPQYMSPEQCMGRPTDHRSDVYALGLILYELLCGRVPFDADTFMGVINQHLVDAPPPLREMYPEIDIPLPLEAVVYRCLDKKAGHRPQSMRDFADEIVAALREGGRHALADQLAPLSAIAEPASAMRLTKRKPSRRPPASLSPALSPQPSPSSHPQPVQSDLAFAETSLNHPVEPLPLPPPQPQQPQPTARPRPPSPTPSGNRPVATSSYPAARGPLWWVAFALGLLLVGGLLGYALVLWG